MSDVYLCLSMFNIDGGIFDFKFVKNFNRWKEVFCNKDGDEKLDMFFEENLCVEDGEGIYVRELFKINIYD